MLFLGCGVFAKACSRRKSDFNGRWHEGAGAIVGGVDVFIGFLGAKGAEAGDGDGVELGKAAADGSREYLGQAARGSGVEAGVARQMAHECSVVHYVVVDVSLEICGLLPDAGGHGVAGTVFDFDEYFADIFADDADAYENESAQEPDGEHERCPSCYGDVAEIGNQYPERHYQADAHHYDTGGEDPAHWAGGEGGDAVD